MTLKRWNPEPIGPPVDNPDLPPDPGPEEFSQTVDDIQISGQGADPTHHIVLEDAEGSKVGFVITDQEGDLDERTFRRFPSADPQTPYVTERQEMFGAGFGQHAFEDNRSRYWRGEGISTLKDQAVCGPMFHYGTGTFDWAVNKDPSGSDSAKFIALNGAFTWLAMSFSPNANWTKTEYIKLWIAHEGTPNTLRVRIYTDSAGNPNTLIHSQDITYNSYVTAWDTADQEGRYVRLDIDDTYAYSSAATYHVVLTTTGTASGRWWVWGADDSGGKKSTDGASWSAGPSFFYRLEGDRVTGVHHFFEYKRQLYWALSKDAYAATEVWMNGWRGVCDPNSGNKLLLNDSSKTEWATDITGNEVVQVYAGPASGEQEDHRFVASGSNGSLTVDRTWQISHTTSDEYIVTNTDRWEQFDDGSNFGGRVSDIALGDGLAYVCRGNNRPIVAFEEYRNSSGNWTSRFISTITPAQFARNVTDPVLGDVIWFAHNNVDGDNQKPYCWYSVPVDGFASFAMDIGNMGPNSGRTNQSWQAAGGAQVTCEDVSGGAAKISVEVGEVTAASVNAAGSGYSQDQTVYVANPDGTQQASFNLDTVVGGEVTAISINDGKWDFDVATGQATTGGSGTGLTIDIDTVSTFSGDIAFLNLYDADGVATTYDLRNMTRIAVNVAFHTKHGAPNALADGDLRIKLSTSQDLGNVISTTSFAGLAAGRKYSVGSAYSSLALTETKGSESITSIGINLNTGHNLDRSFYFKFTGSWWIQKARNLVTVGFVDGDNITGLQAYGDPETAWVFTEHGFGQIKNQRFQPVPNRELKVANHVNNGVGSEVSDVYLLFTWKGRLQRYYRQNMEDLGPDFPAGMNDIQGDVVAVATYPGRIYVAIDGGTTGRSMILCHKGGGWHEVYTSFAGERIRKLFIQGIEGKPDKVWASVGGSVMWFPIVLDDVELPDNSGYTYRPMGYLDTSWIYTGDRDLNKVFRSVVSTLKDTQDTDYEYHLWYRVDREDATWVKIEVEQIKSYSTVEHKLIDGNNPEPRGNRIQFRIQLRTRDIDKTQALRSMLTKMYRIPEIKYIYTWLSKISSISVNLRGDDERAIGTQPTAADAMNKLDQWASNLVVLKMVTDIAAVNGVSVVLEPIPFQLLLMVHDEAMQEESIQLAANEV